MKRRNALLLVNMGGPRNINEVQPFLRRLFEDKDIIELPFQNLLSKVIANLRSGSLRGKYSQIGGSSPIHKWTQLQASKIVKKLEEKYPNESFESFIGFRYSEPEIHDSLDLIERKKFDRAFYVSNYFQYSCTTSGSSINRFCEYYIKCQTSPRNCMKWHFIDRYPTNRKLINAFVQQINSSLLKNNLINDPNTILIFSAHSIPISVMDRGDCYPSEVSATVQSIMKSLDFKYPYRLTWQSKVGPKKWLGPSTQTCISQIIEQNLCKNDVINLDQFKKRVPKFLIIPVTFDCDHIETLHEIEIELRHFLDNKFKCQYEMYRVDSFNACEPYIDVIVDQISKNMKNSSPNTQLMMRCPGCTNQRCIESRNFLSCLKA